MTTPSTLAPLADRVEQLLTQFAQLQHDNRMLIQEVQSLQSERDSLKSRLKAARARVDALIERLPANQEQP